MTILNAKLLVIALCTSYVIATSTTTYFGNIFKVISKEKSSENLVFSPLSIKTCLGLTYLGAEGDTASEIQKGIQLSNANKEQAAQEFSQIIEKFNNDKLTLKIVNRAYLSNNLAASTQFNELASKYFGAATENVNFAENEKAASEINEWIANQTEQKIADLVKSKDFDASTVAVLVNAIYLKALWKRPFAVKNTAKKDFALDKTRHVSVDMMYQQSRLLYAELEDLDALAVELPYRDSDLSMLILLPNVVDGLADMELKLQSIDFLKLAEQLKPVSVRLHLPKFKIAYDISLESVLQELGMGSMFTPAADFRSLLSKADAKLQISQAKHKAFIEINEIGTEAAAATNMQVLLGATRKSYTFVADHPFFFAIKDADNVYFAGHVAHF